MAIICPKCLSDMTEIEHQGVTIDVCPGCRGIWLDPGELAQLRDASEDLPAAPDNIASGTHYLQTSTYICPRCQGSFDTFEYAPGTGLYIDRCKSCQGIYLDAGELQKVRTLTGRRRLLGLESPAESDRELRETMRRERARHGTQEPYSTGGSGRSSSGAGVYFFQLLTGLPVEVDAKRARFPAVTLTLIVINALVFLFQVLAVHDPVHFYSTYAFVPERLFHGGVEGGLGLLTGMFLHGGFLHILGNMYFLWIFGDNVEDRLNRGLFVVFYLLCGIVASLVHGVMTHNPEIPTLGASGAISGIMGAYLVLYPRRRMYQIFFFMQFRVSVAFYLLFWLGLQILYTSMGMAGVAWFAHIGGFAAGAGGIWLLKQAGMVKPDPHVAEAT
jgi:membrane associated rhomboid family serine protease